MLGLDPKLVRHKLNIREETRSVKQTSPNFLPELEVQIKQELQRLLDVGFIKPILHPIWVTKIVQVKKKSGQICCYIDFHDLNKAWPKNEFSLPSIDMLIDATVDRSMLSFIEGFSGYSQIRMDLPDIEKTAFRTPIGNFYYTVGVKTVGASPTDGYDCHLSRYASCLEDYVDDVVVKSKEKQQYVKDLRKVFARCGRFNL